MRCSFRFALGLFVVGSVIASVGANPEMKKGGWDIIPAEELEAAEPQIDKDAACEFLLREMEVKDDDPNRTYFNYHNRVKIFSEAGVDEWSKVDLLYQTGTYIRGIKARVVYPDGSIAHLDHKDVFKRKIYKEGKFEGKAKSFSFPGLKPGCIIEYRWSLVRKFWEPGLDVPLRAEWPTWKTRIDIRPWRGMASGLRLYHTTGTFEQKRGSYFVEVGPQPSRAEKPHLGARKNFEPFVALVYASTIRQFDPDKYWGYRGGALQEINKDFVRGDKGAIKKLAAELFEGKATYEDKLRAAYAYCTEELINIDGYTDVYTEEEIEDLDKNSSPKDTLRNGYGTRYDINGVFASLMAAADFEAVLAKVEDHQTFAFQENVIGNFNLSDWVVAIRIGQSWRFFDPGSSFLPFGTLNPNNAGSRAIVTDRKYYYMVETPEVAEDFSQVNRLARVEINAYGDLEARVEQVLKGYSGLSRKRLFVSLTETEIEDFLQEEEWRPRQPRAEISDLEIRNGDSREKDLYVAYTLKIPGYADLLDDRMILNPNVFNAGAKSPFMHEERSAPIAFDYRERYLDRVEFSVPAGYSVEDLYAAHGKHESAVLHRSSVLEFDDEKDLFVYQRLYYVKAQRIAGIYYEAVKQNFDYVTEADSRLISLQRKSATEEVALAEGGD